MLSSLESIAREIAVAVNIYLPGSMAESAALNDWLTAHPESLAGKTIHSVWIAGMNGFDHAALDPAAKGVAYFTSPALADGLRTGRTKLLSLSFAQIFRALEHAALDLAFLHVSPPDANGWCSFGSC